MENFISDIWRAGEHVFLWGTGKIAQIIYEKCKNHYNVDGFIDNNVRMDTFNGIRVFLPSEIKSANPKIIICIEKSKEVIEQCLYSLGYTFGENFLPYDCLWYANIPTAYISDYADDANFFINKYRQNRKVVTIIGNCHIPIIRQYLQRNAEFSEKYVLTDLPPVHLRQDVKLFELCMDISDIVISQPISIKNKCHEMFGTEKVRGRLKSNQSMILIPNLYFDGYFLTDYPNTNVEMELNRDWEGNDLFPERDLLIENLSKKYSASEIIKIVIDENLFSAEMCQWSVKSRLNELRKREEICDVKMVDFIAQNYKKKQLFYSIKHPSNEAIKEEVVRILKYLNIYSFDSFEDEESIQNLKFYEEKIYPSVFKQLQLEFCKEKFLVFDEGNRLFSEICELYLSHIQSSKV